jgi:hypothetical protein
LKKPTFEIQKFGGDVMQYKRFMNQFKTRVVTYTESDEERMAYLLHFTYGDAYRIIRGYSNLDAGMGYVAALAELNRRFGDPEVIAQAYVRKAIDWPVIKPVIKPDDAKGLDEFALFIMECNYAIQNLNAMQVLEYPEIIKKLVSKLPHYLHDKWRNCVIRTKEDGKLVKFAQFVQLVAFESKKANDPTYGKEAIPRRQPHYAQPENSGIKSSTKPAFRSAQTKGLASSAQCTTEPSQKIECMYCGRNHELNMCEKLQSESHGEKLQFLKSKGMCFACLKRGKHISKDCKHRLTCGKCGKSHPTVLHKSETDFEQTKVQTKVGCVGCQNKGAMAVVPIIVRSRSRSIPTYAFLDSGSSSSFISEELKEALNVTGKPTTMLLSTMSAKDQNVRTSLISDLELTNMEETAVISMPSVYTVGEIPVSEDEIPRQEDIDKWQYLKEVNIPTLSAKVGILIGNNVPKAMEPWQVLNSQGDGPYAVKTLLGWAINGPLKGGQVSNLDEPGRMTVNSISTAELHSQMIHYFNLDFIERGLDDDENGPSVEDKLFLEKVNSSVRFKHGHYEIDLPLRDNTPMPNNKPQAIQRLRYLVKKFRFFTDYKKCIDDLLVNSYAERVTELQIERNDGKVWYLPHHGVYHPKKPDKLRVVFDCAARFAGTSLNDRLLQGPNLTSSLVGVLLRFRLEYVAIIRLVPYVRAWRGFESGRKLCSFTLETLCYLPIAITADIQSMFHQVRVPDYCRDLLRFLWWPDGNFNENPVEYRMAVHLFGAASSPSCANYALRKTAIDNRQKYDKDVTHSVEHNYYVDDYMKSVESDIKASNLAKEMTSLCSEGGFKLNRWNSNRRCVIRSIPEEDRAKNLKDIDLDRDQLPIERVLGVEWAVESDQFCFKIVVKERPPTRRGILSIISSVYDPLGFVAPFLMPARILLQQLCHLKLGFDDPIPLEHKLKWEEWLNDLPKLSDFKIERCVKPPEFGTVKCAEIHMNRIRSTAHSS